MKKYLRIFLLMFPLLWIAPNLGEAASKVSYAVPLYDNVKVYDNRTGSLVPIATMKKNQPLVIDKDYGQNWWQVKFGNGYGFIAKRDVYRSVTWTTNNVNTKAKNSNTTVLINSDVEVFDNTSGKLEPMITIHAGIRYPIISDYSKNYWKVDVGGRIGYMPKYRTSLDYGVPILMYHHILTPGEKANSQFANANTTVTTIEFSNQMQWLKNNGYQTISLYDLERYLRRQVNLPAKAVVLTFDDGITSTREYAYPILKEYGFTAEQFIITSRIPSEKQPFQWDTLRFFSKQDMDELSDVFRYGSHTHDLHSLVGNKAKGVTISYKALYNDLAKSRNILGTYYFAYPFGQYNQNYLNAVKKAGYRMAVTTRKGKVNLGEDLYTLERLGIEPGLSMDEFAKKVGNYK
ncbi:polysaccharide deacetylase family protein [Ureibacillus sp. FSL K6-3587]|uniref:polysaccharide deacetylase family protein n=1 Tax=Ureibacillus sp. FSL K6-3587 TaxID=2954681 RepID=UPI00315920D0